MSAHMSSARWRRWARTINLHLSGAGCSSDHAVAARVAQRRLAESREMHTAFLQLNDQEVVAGCEADIAFCESALSFYSQSGVSIPVIGATQP